MCCDNVFVFQTYVVEVRETPGTEPIVLSRDLQVTNRVVENLSRNTTYFVRVYAKANGKFGPRTVATATTRYGRNYFATQSALFNI